MELQAVVTTGIYCRADCTAKPLARNVRPMANAVTAQARGFRPCLRCRPDRLPAGLGAEREAVPAPVAEAIVLIADGFLDLASTDDLAARVGYSARHLVRLFEEHVGASPDFVARSRRAHLARRLLDETDLSVTDIAFASGFSSTRQMHRVVRSIFGFAPQELRSKRRSGDQLDPLDGGLRVRVPFDPPLDVARLISYLDARAVPGVESVVGGVYRRTMASCGAPGVVEVAADSGSNALLVTMHLPTFGSILDEVEGVRRLFGLHQRPEAASELAAADPLMRRLIASAPGLRLPGAYDRFETAIRIIVGQQVSVPGASTLTGRIVERAGTPIASDLPGGLTHLFPTPVQLAAADLTGVGMPERRIDTITSFAAAIASGELHLATGGSQAERLAALQAQPGIGPWTAQLIAARAHGDPDVFPDGDLGLRKNHAIQAGFAEPLAAAELARAAERWAPNRSLAAAYVWMAGGESTSTQRATPTKRTSKRRAKKVLK